MNHEIHPPKRVRHLKPEAGAVLVRPVALEDEEDVRGMLSRLSRRLEVRESRRTGAGKLKVTGAEELAT